MVSLTFWEFQVGFIYNNEGDVLQCIYANEEEPEIIIGKVEFDEEEAVYILIFGENKDYLFNMQVEHYAKVIGNIYINPELLEEK